jgi:hypothetical protein
MNTGESHEKFSGSVHELRVGDLVAFFSYFSRGIKNEA